MTEIDELEGKALADTVAMARGWTQHAGRLSGIAHWYDENGDMTKHQVYHYRPDRDIGQAWELDGEGWLWEFDEEYERHGNLLTANVWKGGDVLSSALVRFADFPTKAHAYATARCRAYLKAKEANEQPTGNS